MVCVVCFWFEFLSTQTSVFCVYCTCRYKVLRKKYAYPKDDSWSQVSNLLWPYVSTISSWSLSAATLPTLSVQSQKRILANHQSLLAKSSCQSSFLATILMYLKTTLFTQPKLWLSVVAPMFCTNSRKELEACVLMVKIHVFLVSACLWGCWNICLISLLAPTFNRYSYMYNATVY